MLLAYVQRLHLSYRGPMYLRSSLYFAVHGVSCTLPCDGALLTLAVTLDPFQFYFASNLWNWFDPQQPGYDPANVANVEWTNWSSTSATMIAWRDWGSQFRMPTPQPNIASPQLLATVSQAVAEVVNGIRKWYEAQTPIDQRLLVAVKLCEELDVGANYYFYPNGNAIYQAHPHNSSADPTYGLDSAKGLAGGLMPLGYNMIQTLGLRSGGVPPTRRELTLGVQHYFRSAIAAAVKAWPLLGSNRMLFAHGGYGAQVFCSFPFFMAQENAEEKAVEAVRMVGRGEGRKGWGGADVAVSIHR